MRVLVLHSDVPADAPADELDTLLTAQAVERTLAARGHHVSRHAFELVWPQLEAAIAQVHAEIVFNLVESVQGDGFLACIAPAMLEKTGLAFTGASAAALAVCADKIMAKHLLRAAGVPTPDWSEAPEWRGLVDGERYIVKSATEDASLGLDDDAVVESGAVRQRVRKSMSAHGGAWFAERYLAGREFNVALLESERGMRVLPIAEMCFDMWPEGRPQIVGYSAKWDETSEDARKTVRRFGLEDENPALAGRITEMVLEACKLFRLRGYARIDLRTDERGNPFVLEANPNPCLEPGAGFAAAAARSGMDFPELLERILQAAQKSR